MIEKQTKKLLANEARRDVLNLRHKYCYFNEKRLWNALIELANQQSWYLLFSYASVHEEENSEALLLLHMETS